MRLGLVTFAKVNSMYGTFSWNFELKSMKFALVLLDVLINRCPKRDDHSMPRAL